MTDHTRGPADLIAVLTAEADDIASPQELLDRARVDSPRTRSTGSHRRQWRAPAAVIVSVLIVVAAVLTVWTVDQRHSRPATPTPANGATKEITFSGVSLTIPASWPVIDGAHAAHTCSATFLGQSDRAFLGTSYRGVPSCAASIGTPPLADGVWMQPGGSTPTQQASTTLAAGQQVYLSAGTVSSVAVWYHGVSIQIGVGPDRAIEEAILNSIRYTAASANSAVLGRCPTPNSSPPQLPAPARVTAPLVLEGSNGRLVPEPSDVEPAVNAGTVWISFLHSVGGSNYGPLQWSIVFGSYSAQTPAQINPDGSATPFYRNVPTWLIRGKGIPTDYGPCGITVLAPYNADTGQDMGVTTIG